MSRNGAALETLASFLPRWVRRSVGEAPHHPPPIRKQWDGAAMFVDIAGFTSMTDTFARSGVSGGAERLSHLLDQYFGRLITLCYTYRGDAAAFVGDAAIFIWPGELETALLRASQCALEVQASLTQVDFGDGLRLQQRVSIGVGSFDAWELGNETRRLTLLRGDVLEQIGRCHATAEIGRVRLSAEARDLGKNILKGIADEKGLWLEGVEETELTNSQLKNVQGSIAPLDALRPYVPLPMLRRLDAGLPARHGEFRTVTAVFANLSDIQEDQLQSSICALIDVVSVHGGNISQLLHDEKGTTLVLTFGVPLMSREDDAARGVQAALRMREVLAEIGVEPSIGISTGRTFCGAYGNEQRRHYDSLGAAMNLASRLMVGAKGKVLCDAATVRSIRSGQGVRFETAGVLNVKGRVEPVPVFVPGRAERRRRPRREVVGRTSERAALREAVQNSIKGLGGIRVRIEGEQGIGKTAVLQDLIELLRGTGHHVITAYGSALDANTPFSTWRSLWRALSDQGSAGNTDAERRDPRFLFEASDRRTLPIDPGMDSSFLDRIIPLVKRGPNAPPLVITIDDAHWMDGASLDLLRLLCEKVPQLGVITCSLQDTRLDSAKGWLRIRLGSLSRAESDGLICRRLGVSEVPAEVLQFVWSRAEGHPFFSEELAQALRDEGVINVEDGECLLSDPEGLARLAFPSSVEGLITARTDALSPSAHQVLQVASVLGRYIPLEALVHLLELPESRVGMLLSELITASLITLESLSPEPVYAFRHAIVQDVSYNQLLFAARRRYHQRAAEWMEATHGDREPALYALLAHHWSRAQDPTRALIWLERAGLHARQSWALLESAVFFREALNLASQPADRLRQHLHLGDLALHLRDAEGAKLQLAHAQKLLGIQEPSLSLLLVSGLNVVKGARPSHDSPTAALFLGLAEASWLELNQRSLFQNALISAGNDASNSTLALSEALLSIALVAAGWPRLAARCWERARNRQLSDPELLARLWFYGGHYTMAIGGPAVGLFDQAITLSAEDRLLSAEARLALGWLSLLKGQADEAEKRASAIDHLTEEMRGGLGLGASTLRLAAGTQRAQPNMEELDRVERLLEGRATRLDRILAHSAAADALWAQKSPGPARQHAEAALGLLNDATPMAWQLIWAFERLNPILIEGEHKNHFHLLHKRLRQAIPIASAGR